MKKVILAVMVTSVLAGTAFAMRGKDLPPVGFHGVGPGKAMLGALKRLNLTDSQKHEIALVLQEHREEARGTKDAMQQALEELRATAEAGEWDEAVIRQAFQPVAAAAEEVAVQMTGLVAELREILTPEQQEMLEKYRDGMLEKMNSRRERRQFLLDEWIEDYTQ
jgi:Spy/CpxP family protein refolding chaperone